MATDSRVGPLPLADALIDWSDPALVDAIRAEEAKFPPGRLEELDHYTLADVRTLRRNPKGYRPMSSREATAALDRSWARLIAAFRHRVERGEFWLEGAQTITFGNPGPVPLPRELAAQYDIDPPAGAVKVGVMTYVGVTVQRVLATVDSPGNAPAPRRDLPLLEAFSTWQDPDLAARVRKLQVMASGMSHVAPPEDESGLTDEQRSRRAVTLLALAYTPEKALELALRDQLVDFRRKIEAGDLEIAGVQTYPERETERRPIPALWASDFSFDFENNKVSVVQFNRVKYMYIAVMVSGPQPPEQAPPETWSMPPDEAAPPPLDDPESDQQSSDVDDTVIGRAGRPPFPMDDFVAIARSRLDRRRPTNKEEAYELLREFERLNPGRKVPAYREVRDHASRIYMAAAADAVPLIPPK